MWEKQLEGHLKLCVMLAAGAAVKRVLILTFFVEQPILLLLLPSCHEIPTLPERPKPPNCHFTQFSEDTLMGPKPPDCYFAQFSEDNIRVPTPFDCLAGFFVGPNIKFVLQHFTQFSSDNPVGSKLTWYGSTNIQQHFAQLWY